MAFTITVGPASFNSPDGGGFAFDSINTGGGFASLSDGSSGGGGSYNLSETARWNNFSTNFGGMGPNDIQLLQGAFDWSAGGNANVSVDTDGSANAGGFATADIFGGGSGSDGFFLSWGASISGPGPVSDSDSASDGNTEVATFTPNTLGSITGAQCTASINISGDSGISGSTGIGTSDAAISISAPRIHVTLTDRKIMAC